MEELVRLWHPILFIQIKFVFQKINGEFFSCIIFIICFSAYLSNFTLFVIYTTYSNMTYSYRFGIADSGRDGMSGDAYYKISLNGECRYTY